MVQVDARHRADSPDSHASGLAGRFHVADGGASRRDRVRCQRCRNQRSRQRTPLSASVCDPSRTVIVVTASNWNRYPLLWLDGTEAVGSNNNRGNDEGFRAAGVRSGSEMDRGDLPTPGPVRFGAGSGGVAEWLRPVGGKQLSEGHDGAQLPCGAGQDFAGEVDAVGPDVEGYQVGDRVLGVVMKDTLGMARSGST